MTLHILVVIISVCLLTIYVSVQSGQRTVIDDYIRIFLGYLALHAAHEWTARVIFVENLQLDLYDPYGLMYGPFLYVGHRLARGHQLRWREALPHLIPFAIGLVGYLLSMIFSPLFRDYLPFLGYFLYSLPSLSLISYALWALFFRGSTISGEEERLVSMLATVLFIMGIVMLAFTYSGIVSGNLRSERKETMFFLGTLGVAVILFSHVIRQVVGQAGDNARQDAAVKAVATGPVAVDREEKPDMDSRYQKSAIATELLDAYEKQVRKYVWEDNAYLDEALSLDTLAQQLKIPKHHLSQVFSLRIGKNFNTCINEQRVNHATSLMHAHPEMTITTIYVKSGFTAKASFNRYFKQFQGCTPTEYRNQLNLK